MTEPAQPILEPSAIVRSLMDSKGWTQADLAYVLAVTPATVNQIVKGRRPITPEMARALALALDASETELAEIQARWNVANAAAPDASIQQRAKVQSNYPLRDMIKRGWIGDPSEGADLNSELCRFFGVNDLEQAPHLAHSARKTSYEIIPPGSQLAWVFRVRQIAREMVTSSYSKQKLVETMERLATLRASPEEIRHVPRLLSECGVRLVVVEGLPGGRIDGVCLWLDDETPVIGLSLRFDRIDNFWFVLAHECAHVLHGHGKDQDIIDADLDPRADVSEEERLANREASEFCVPQSKIESFYLRKKPFFSDRDVAAFAKINGVHPGLVVGQLHHMSGQYKILRQHLVKVRPYVSMSAIVDGWGDIVPVG